MRETVRTVVKERNVPEAIRSLSNMDSPDYASLFTATTAQAADRSPEEWARAIVAGVPAASRLIVWRAICGLRLDPGASADHIAGWRIADRGETWLRAEAASSFLTAHIVFQVDDRQLSFATFVRYDRPRAAVVWPPVAVVHHRAVPYLLRTAVRRVSSRN